MDLCQRLGEHVLSRGIPFLAGGDFNLTPAELSIGCEPERFGGEAVFDPSVHTCTVGESFRTIDYFVISKVLVKTFLSVNADLSSDVFPHKAVDLHLTSETFFIQVERLAAYESLP
eukprot:312219-Pyramimonas_sp.AAC.1